MQDVTSRSEASDLARFRRLTSWTIVATLILILIGGIVRISDSGLGCGPEGAGIHGWPLCEGGVLPERSSESIIEFSHRIAAGIVAILMLAMAVIALRHLRSHTWIVRGSVAAGVLVLIQAGLGGLTVEEGLDEYLVAAHLGLAMLLLGLLIFVRRLAGDPTPRPAAGSRGLRASIAASTVLILATIVAGGLVAGTEGHGTPDKPEAGAHTACGTEFPTCGNGEFMPFGRDRLVDIQLVHRGFMYLTVIAVFITVLLALRRRVGVPQFATLGALVAAQVLLGALNIWLGKHAGLIVGHLMLGTFVWASAVWAWTTIMRVPEPKPEPAGIRPGGQEAATA